MGWLSLCIDKITFLFSGWRRAPAKGRRVWQQCSLLALQQQRNGWLLTLLSQVFDLLLLPELIDVVWQLTKPNTRGLSDIELHEAKRVFGDALPYKQIRIDEWSLIAWLGAISASSKQMGISTFYTINFTRKLQSSSGSNDMGWLIHELVHIAQMHHLGSRYIWEAIYAQHSPEGYDYGGPNKLAGKKLSDFNREQQGDIVRHYYEYVLCEEQEPRFRTHFQVQHYQTHIEELRQGRL